MQRVLPPMSNSQDKTARSALQALTHPHTYIKTFTPTQNKLQNQARNTETPKNIHKTHIQKS